MAIKAVKFQFQPRRDFIILIHHTGEHPLHRDNLVKAVSFARRFRVRQAGGILRNNPGEPGREPVSREHVLCADIFNIAELVFNAGVANGDKLDPFLAAVCDVDIHHFKIANPFRLLDFFCNVVLHLIREIRVGGVDNPASVGAVVVVAPAKYRRLGIE